jgi:hypothetical protein
MAEANLHEILGKQYRASIAMLGQAVTECPESLWLASDYPMSASVHSVFKLF